jgi:hypothetical protein
MCVEPLEPTYTAISERVLPGCVACHQGSGAPEGLDLSDAETAYGNLVDVPSRQSPHLMRVEPGNAENSYLIHKLTGEGMAESSSTGDPSNQMPVGGPFLCDAKIDSIREWIDDGAAPE